MSDEHNLKNSFQLVTYKNRSKNRKKPIFSSKSEEFQDNFNSVTVTRRILEAKEDLKGSDLYSSFFASLREGLSYLGNRKIEEIICFGLGRFGECIISRYQLSLLLCIREIYDVPIKVFDPVFNQNEIDLLKNFQFSVPNQNCEGKYKSNPGNLSLFYLPHCPKQLTNNLLWKNWGLNLRDCIIISNSFTSIFENNSTRILSRSANYILKIFPYTLELAIINTFKFFDVFNDTAIHIFPPEKLLLISKDFWEDSKEPKYDSDDLEFIVNQIESIEI